MRDFDKIMWYLLEETETSICFSSIIPTKNCNSLNKAIDEINSSVKSLVTDVRAMNHLHKTCLFTYNNVYVSYHNNISSSGTSTTLSEIGKLTMWKRLGDAIRKTLRMYRPQFNNHTTQRSGNHLNSDIYG